MTKTLISTAILCLLGASGAWALSGSDANAGWVGQEYDARWNAERDALLRSWQRQSTKPDNVETCLSVGQVWYCPATQALVQESSTR